MIIKAIIWWKARYFSGEDIDEFRDCFYLKTHSNGHISTIDELKIIMRSLGMSPTLTELKQYFKEKGLKVFIIDRHLYEY